MSLLRKWNRFYIFLLTANLNILAEAGVLPLTLQKHTPAEQHQEQSSTIATSIAHRFAGYIEYQPNGTVVLRSNSLENATNLQNLLLFKAILKAIKMTSAIEGSAQVPQGEPGKDMKFSIKIYGDGIEHKFPPFLERFIQRIQTYFSVYRYTDTSRPVRYETSTSNTYGSTGTATTTTTLIAGSPLDYLNNLESTTFIDVDAATQGTTYGIDDDYPEFIEIKANDDVTTTVDHD